LFSLWRERGDPERLARAVEAHADWMKEAWDPIARYQASKNQFRKAFEIVQRFGSAPVMPQTVEGSPIEQLEREFHANPANFGVGYQLYREQLKAGRTDDALATVRHFTALPNCPRYFHYLEGETWATRQNWERAWNSWKIFKEEEEKKGR
jgi:hypothetical protein